MEDSLDSKHNAFSRVLRVTTMKSASAVSYAVAVLGLAILIPNLQLPPELSILSGGLGINALSSILDRVAKNELSDDEILDEIENLISGEISKLVTKNDFFHAFQLLVRSQNVLSKQNQEMYRTLQQLNTPSKPNESETAVNLDNGSELTAVRVNKENVLQIKSTFVENEYISIQYFINGNVIAQSKLSSPELTNIADTIAVDFPRVIYRFGSQSITPLIDIAQRLSNMLLPIRVARYFRQKQISQIHIMMEDSSPIIPWELLYDENRFLALEVPLINKVATPSQENRQPFDPKSILVVEAVGTQFGLSLNTLSTNFLSKIRSDIFSVSIRQISSFPQFQDIVRVIDFDVLHYVGHTGFDYHDQALSFLMGDRFLSVDSFGTLLFHTSDKSRLVMLDACESARSSNNREYQTNTAYLLAKKGLHAIGASFWLQLTTSELFNEEFYGCLAEGKDIETALLYSRKLLESEGETWWTHSYYSPLEI